jgi:hypothetical protein
MIVKNEKIVSGDFSQPSKLGLLFSAHLKAVIVAISCFLLIGGVSVTIILISDKSHKPALSSKNKVDSQSNSNPAPTATNNTVPGKSSAATGTGGSKGSSSTTTSTKTTPKAVVNSAKKSSTSNTSTNTTAAPSSASGSTTIVSATICNTPTSALAVHVCNGHLVNGQLQPLRLLGASASGTEDACIQNDGTSYGLSSTVAEDQSAAAGLKSWHINVVRVPLNEDCWLNINGSPAAYSGQNYQTAISNWVTALNNAGIYAILDLHWSAPGSTEATGQTIMPDEDHSPTFWNQVASAYKNNPAVIFDLFNEPYEGYDTNTPASAWSCWENGCLNTEGSTFQTAGMQQLLSTVRATGAKQPIMLGGLAAAEDPCGLNLAGGNGGVCQQIKYMPFDPLDQQIISVHCYPPNSQDNADCGGDDTNWNIDINAAKAANIPLVFGEIGEADGSDTFFNNFLNWANQQNISYLAWSWEVNQGSGSYGLLSNFDGTPASSSTYPLASLYKSNMAAEASTE